MILYPDLIRCGFVSRNFSIPVNQEFAISLNGFPNQLRGCLHSNYPQTFSINKKGGSSKTRQLDYVRVHLEKKTHETATTISSFGHAKSPISCCHG